jgi:glycosyltransferase involved in cell wall biosynthesis
MISNDKSKMISVITPSLNSVRYIDDAIKSVLSQNYANFEHIIVDGGSTDGTVDILKRYNHLKWVSEPDSGQSDAMNKGFKMSSGDIIVYLNADDFFEPGAFDSVAFPFSHSAKFVVGNIRVIEATGTISINNGKTRFEEMLKWWKADAFCYNPVGYFYVREVQEQIGFNTDNHLSMDLEFLLDAALKYPITKIGRILGNFRYFPGTKTFENSSPHSQAASLTFLDRYLDLCSKEYVERYIAEREEFLSNPLQD